MEAPAPPIFTSICPGPGWGTGTSRNSGGFCHATSWNALIVSSSLADAVDIYQDVPRTAEDLVVPVGRWIDDEPRILYAAHELSHRYLGLQPCQRTAETEVDTTAEPEVLVVAALDV